MQKSQEELNAWWCRHASDAVGMLMDTPMGAECSLHRDRGVAIRANQMCRPAHVAGLGVDRSRCLELSASRLGAGNYAPLASNWAQSGEGKGVCGHSRPPCGGNGKERDMGKWMRAHKSACLS